MSATCSVLFAVSPEPVAMPRFTHPGAGQTVYFILTDRFANGRTDNDTGGLTGGAMDHGFDPTRISHYHGGDFAGLTAKLDYLKELGMTAVWVTPPFKNKPVQSGTAGYHGYWITDFLSIDPHLGTNDEYREFVRQAHARGLRVYMDIIVNHTADVIRYEGGSVEYRTRSLAPYRDAAGRAYDERQVAFNGQNAAGAFPPLDAAKSFPYTPVVPEGERAAKTPGWLNDPVYYHNRGNSLFLGENSVHGDFVGLDDLFTEHPRVVEGMVDIFTQWLDLGVDGYRIDTVRHVNNEFWQAFSPAIRARARERGREDFLQFAEVYNDAGDPAVLAEFSTNVVPIDTTLDFGFFAAARRFVSQAGTSAGLADFFARDDYYTDHDGNVHSTPTFLGNHDAGRFAYFLQQDNAGASGAQMLALAKLGHGLMYLSRGQPVIYYGDEQGMIGAGGNDMQARETMFGAVAPEFREAKLLGTTRTGADDKFDARHPLYRYLARLGALRSQHAALRTGAMIVRSTGDDSVAAFSRVERGELVEYVVALNNSRVRRVPVEVPTSQPAGATLRCVFDSEAEAPDVARQVNGGGALPVALAPLQLQVWRAERPLVSTPQPVQIELATPVSGGVFAGGTREIDGLVFPQRRELRAEVLGGDGVGEVTFLLRRASRPEQYDLLGVDDSAPYRVFWSPPSDLQPGEQFDVVATYSDLRGHSCAVQAEGLQIAASKQAHGIVGARTPTIRQMPPSTVVSSPGRAVTLMVEAEGSGALEFQWFREGHPIVGETNTQLVIPSFSEGDAGHYRVQVRNFAGTAVGRAIQLQVSN